jgi:hypothetical protein
VVAFLGSVNKRSNMDHLLHDMLETHAFFLMSVSKALPIEAATPANMLQHSTPQHANGHTKHAMCHRPVSFCIAHTLSPAYVCSISGSDCGSEGLQARCSHLTVAEPRALVHVPCSIVVLFLSERMIATV